MIQRNVGDIWFYNMPGCNRRYLLLEGKQRVERELWDALCLETGQYCKAEFSDFSIPFWKKVA